MAEGEVTISGIFHVSLHGVHDTRLPYLYELKGWA
jgi:hypothetical protein